MKENYEQIFECVRDPRRQMSGFVLQYRRTNILEVRLENGLGLRINRFE